MKTIEITDFIELLLSLSIILSVLTYLIPTTIALYRVDGIINKINVRPQWKKNKAIERMNDEWVHSQK